MKMIKAHEDRLEYTGIDIEEIKSTPIREVLVNYGVDVSGKSCCCPIHKEKTPSCMIYDKTNSFSCFGCHAGGSVIDLVMGIEKVNIKDAINILITM